MDGRSRGRHLPSSILLRPVRRGRSGARRGGGAVQQGELCLAQRLGFALRGILHPATVKIAHNAAGAEVVHVPERGQHSLSLLLLRDHPQAVHLNTVARFVIFRRAAGRQSEKARAVKCDLGVFHVGEIPRKSVGVARVHLCRSAKYNFSTKRR